MCDQFSAGGSLAGLLHTQKPCAIGIFSSSAGGNPVLHNTGCRLRGTEGLEQPPGDARTTSTPKPHHLEAHGGSTRESHQSGCRTVDLSSQCMAVPDELFYSWGGTEHPSDMPKPLGTRFPSPPSAMRLSGLAGHRRRSRPTPEEFPSLSLCSHAFQR